MQSVGCKFWDKITTFGFHWWHCWCCGMRSRTCCWMKTTIAVDTFGQGWHVSFSIVVSRNFLTGSYTIQFEFCMDNCSQLCSFICHHVTKVGLYACFSAWTRGSHSDSVSLAPFELPWSNSSSNSLIMTCNVCIRYPKLAFLPAAHQDRNILVSTPGRILIWNAFELRGGALSQTVNRVHRTWLQVPGTTRWY